ncbi:uncharacterized protein [Haliotis cracherodii]|uniref:uncharacterized protein n=1 Tax=Haliotis cracherodii TaxID=6455 RepID=UPI0039E99839
MARVWTFFFLALTVNHSLQWRGCCAWGYIRVARYDVAKKCCPGWTHNGDEDCRIAQCNPPCANDGTCTSPGRCSCRAGYSGDTCNGANCNHERPCYPGSCQANGATVVCNCLPDFRGEYCKELGAIQAPVVTQLQAEFNFREGGQQYGVLADFSTEVHEPVVVWTNMDKLNELSVNATAMFKGKELPYPPAYIKTAETGIGRAYVKWSGPRVTSEERDYECEGTIDSEHPQKLVKCVVKREYRNRLKDGDKFKLTFRVTSGGYRELFDTGNNRVTATEHYTGPETIRSVAFNIDLTKPAFTEADASFQVHPEFTKKGITMKWEGWTDDGSQMDKYTWEAFKLEPNGDGDLMEVDKLRPIIHRQVDHTSPISYPLPYEPDKPGMYSFILQAVDKANNSEYMRRFALYDKESTVTTDPNHAMNISYVVRDQGFQWMTDTSKPLLVNWENRFLNYHHESGKFLNKILPFKVQIVEDPPIYKQVINTNDDHHGERTVDAILNVRGIVKFEWTHDVNKTGGRRQDTPPNWSDVSGLKSTMQFQPEGVTSGSTVTVWIRARDILDNKKVDSTSVTYDFTKPQITRMAFHENEISNIPFSSGLELNMLDKESGIGRVEVKVIQTGNGHLMSSRNLTVPTLTPSACTDRVKDCYCPNALNVCYKRVYKLYISNCWLMVAKGALKSAEVKLEVGVVNRAGLKTPTPVVHVVKDLMKLNGTEAYFGLENVTTTKITTSSARVSWKHAPSCHERTVILVSFESESGHKETLKVFQSATHYVLNGLQPGTSYKVKVTAKYGDILSIPKQVSITTMDASGIGTGTIAGISTGLGVVVVVAVVVVLRRTGGHRFLSSRRQPVETARIANNLDPTRPRMASFKNKSYAEDDDIYHYASMPFSTLQAKEIASDKLTLKKEIQSGRFARIYKASLKSGKTQQEVVAKVLKDTHDEDSALLMMAKINFAATKVGEHRNVLNFIGAVVSNDALGPVMVLEYCQNGQLDKWLNAKRTAVSTDVFDTIQTITLGISRGMEYLSKRQIVHRKLAARNCLLTPENEIKISGFGPSSMEEAAEDNSKGKESSSQDRIPIKWTAPECLQSLKGADEKSDIWSFGITMWEIFSLGQTPYPDIRSRDLPIKLKNGYRLPNPEYAEEIHQDIMQGCWKQNPKERPTFANVVEKLETSFGYRPGESGEVYYTAT